MRTHLKRKEVDDVMGGKDSWKNVDQTEGGFAFAWDLDVLMLSMNGLAFGRVFGRGSGEEDRGEEEGE
jgi:hypothetical protein